MANGVCNEDGVVERLLSLMAHFVKSWLFWIPDLLLIKRVVLQHPPKILGKILESDFHA